MARLLSFLILLTHLSVVSFAFSDRYQMVRVDLGHGKSEVTAADAQTYYYLYFRTSPQEGWRFWAGYKTREEAQAAEIEVKSYGYETFIRAASVTHSYQVYYRRSANEEWRLWAAFGSVSEAERAEREIKSQGYETFIQSPTPQ